MNQRGNKVNPIDMDNLQYRYRPKTNQLVKVTDAVNPLATSNLPDFKDNANLLTEYTYDNNGNLLTDANKAITSITYNHLNKPMVITVQGKGTISYVYDATGNRLRKTIIDAVAQTTEVWDYIGSMVYKNNVLQYILNEEGRSRPEAITAGNQAGATKFVYDYFIKDHLGNVRTTLAAEPASHEYYAMHELATANSEQLIFDNIAAVRDEKPGSISPDDLKAARLNASEADRRIGTAIMLRVMPGDQFTFATDAYYEADEEPKDYEHTSAEDIVSSLLATLKGGTVGGQPVGETEVASLINEVFSRPETVTGIEDILNSSTTSGTAPRAGLNYLFFDEQMNLLSGSGRLSVGPVAPGIFDNLSSERVTSTEPGILVVYVDNQTIGKDVWFDNVQVLHYNTLVLEENHYYPFGLTVSANAIGITAQPLKYNGKELETSFDLQTYEYVARQYNSQIGRWNGIDPLANKYYSISPFVYVANNPVKFIDPDGKVIMDASIKQNYPYFYNYINNHVGNLFLGSQAILNTLTKYSVGGLNRQTIKHAMTPGKGPNVVVVDMPEGQNGEFVAKSNTIKLSSRLVSMYNKVMNGEMKATDDAKTGATIELTSTFINEFTHYGDELDGIQANIDENGNVFNDPTISGWIKPFDEGNAAAQEVYNILSPNAGKGAEVQNRVDIINGIKNLFLLRNGVYVDDKLKPVSAPDPELIDQTRIPTINVSGQ